MKDNLAKRYKQFRELIHYDTIEPLEIERTMAKTALITGASQGIGKATVLELAKHGYDVVLVAREPERLETVAAEVRDLGQKAIALLIMRSPNSTLSITV